jgi:NAD(P)-dependent dehydrogenase (short-subunit alcohol dehydrogenase family)
MSRRMEGKAGVITAAGSGMGRAGALRLALEGATVAVVDIDEQGAASAVAAITSGGGEAFAICGDLTDDGFARRVVDDAAARFGGLDFLWNNCGHPGPAAFEEMDMDLFTLAMDLNLRANVITSSQAIPHLRARGGGCLLFTASTAGIVSSPFSPVYSAGKFAAVGLARSLARRYAKENIRTNVICPGSTDTPMLRVFQNRPDAATKTSDEVEATVAQYGAMNPMGRHAQPEDIANAALYLLSDEAAYVNGAVLAVDGGATA